MVQNRFQDFLQLAIEKEQDAAGLYEKYSRLVKSSSAKKLLADMALMERGHEKKLKNFQATGSAFFSKIGAITDMHISDFMTPPELHDDSSVQDIFVFSMKEEQKAHDLYSRLASLETDSLTKKLFSTMADEELKHKHDLESEYEKEFMQDN